MDDYIEGSIFFGWWDDDRYDSFEEAFAAACQVQKPLLENNYTVLMYVEETAIILNYNYERNKALKLGSPLFAAVSAEEFEDLMYRRSDTEEHDQDED